MNVSNSQTMKNEWPKDDPTSFELQETVTELSGLSQTENKLKDIQK